MSERLVNRCGRIRTEIRGEFLLIREFRFERLRHVRRTITVVGNEASRVTTATTNSAEGLMFADGILFRMAKAGN